MTILPTKREAELLDILQEEAAEVIQAVAKIKRHGWDSYNPDILASPDNQVHLGREVAQLLTVVGLLLDDGYFSESDMEEESKRKIKQLEKYTHFQEFSIDKWTE